MSGSSPVRTSPGEWVFRVGCQTTLRRQWFLATITLRLGGGVCAAPVSQAVDGRRRVEDLPTQ